MPPGSIPEQRAAERFQFTWTVSQKITGHGTRVIQTAAMQDLVIYILCNRFVERDIPCPCDSIGFTYQCPELLQPLRMFSQPARRTAVIGSNRIIGTIQDKLMPQFGTQIGNGRAFQLPFVIATSAAPAVPGLDTSRRA